MSIGTQNDYNERFPEEPTPPTFINVKIPYKVYRTIEALQGQGERLPTDVIRSALADWMGCKYAQHIIIRPDTLLAVLNKVNQQNDQKEGGGYTAPRDLAEAINTILQDWAAEESPVVNYESARAELQRVFELGGEGNQQ